jgi:DNA invertase Pin-like site-specific DNA recombinase
VAAPPANTHSQPGVNGAVRAAIAVRVSTVEQDREGKHSLDEQLDKCRAEIARRGWTLDERHVFVDRVSGDKRSRFDRPLAAAHNREFDAILFTKVSRLARNMLDIVAVEEELRELGIGLVCIDQPFDTTTPAGRAQFQMLAVFAEWEKANLLDQMAGGVHAIAKRGGARYVGGEVPYGLMVTGSKGDADRQLVPDPAEVGVIKTAYDLIVNQRRSTWDTAKELNARGLKPRKAARWNNVLVRAMLSRESLRGVMVWAKEPRPTWTRKGRGERSHMTTGKYGGPVTMEIPAVLSEEEWWRLQAVLGSSSTPTPTRSPNRYLLSGRGHQRLWAPCGGVMTGIHQAGRGRRYRCNYARAELPEELRCDCRRIDADELEQLVTAYILAMFAKPDVLHEVVQRWLEPEPVSIQSTAEDLDGRIAALERKRTNIILAVADLGPEAIAEAVAQVEADLETLRRRRELRQSALDQRAEAKARIPEILAYVGKAVHLDADGWRNLLTRMDVRVTITSWLPEGLRTPIGDPMPPYLWRIEGNLHRARVGRLASARCLAAEVVAEPAARDHRDPRRRAGSRRAPAGSGCRWRRGRAGPTGWRC